ncbi:MAG: 30S ribosomal protein S16 [bacterium]|jgi:small subunit ribosomal protein S16|nr:30S ribosomal protein S16 [Planctomycetota bacterium]HIL50638.1 30S ribosomal protein S16 [Planctomycetota bacterium]
MAVVIRMKRTGRRNRPCYRITVADSRSPRDGRFIENLGVYDPISVDGEKQVRLDVERAKYWVGQGAQPSDTVRSLFKRGGVFEGLPTGKPRKRKGRGKITEKGKRRTARKTACAERKLARRGERVTTKRAAAAAAKAAEGGEGDK